MQQNFEELKAPKFYYSILIREKVARVLLKVHIQSRLPYTKNAAQFMFDVLLLRTGRLPVNMEKELDNDLFFPNSFIKPRHIVQFKI